MGHNGDDRRDGRKERKTSQAHGVKATPPFISCDQQVRVQPV